MKAETFDILGLATEITEVVLGLSEITRESLLPKVVSCIQKSVDKKLVPRNFNQYESKKKKEARTLALIKMDYETKFWKETVKAFDPNRIQVYYDKLNQLLTMEGLRQPDKRGSQILCFYCERKMDAAKFGGVIGIHTTLDHVIPKSKLGKTNYGNLVNACNECNLLKSNLSLKTFIKRLERLIELNIGHGSITVDLYPTIIKNVNRLITKKRFSQHEMYLH